MHIISRKKLRDFSLKHATAKGPLDAWWAEVKHAEWRHFSDITAQYNSADMVGDNRIVFNIGGNNYRMVVKVTYKFGKVFILWLGTHAEYDKIDVTKL